MRKLLCLLLLCTFAFAQTPTRTPAPLLPWSQQIALREQWLLKRHQMILPMMRAHAIDMWIVVNEEFHDDPLTQYIAPPRPYAGNRDIFVFVDAGADGLKRHAVTGFWEEALSRYFETDRDPKKWNEAMKALWEKYRPKTIAFTSRTAASLFYRRPTHEIALGRQPPTSGFPEMFVLSSPSGAASGHWTLQPWRDLAQWIGPA